MLLTEETDHAFSQGLSAAGCLQHLAEHGSQSHYDGHCAESTSHAVLDTCRNVC